MANKLKSLTVAMLAMAAFSGINAAQAASSTVSGGTIHFTGEVVNAACAVAPESADQTVPLGQVRAASLADAGSTANPTAFSIKLNDCDTSVSTTAAISFYGPATTAGDALSVSSITTTGAAATNVGIQILDRNNTVVKPNTDVPSSAYTLIDGANTLPFTAQFVSTDGGATAGAADADATFNVAYN